MSNVIDAFSENLINSPLYVDDLFLQDTLDLFSARKTGHMNAYAFNEPDLSIPDDPVRGGDYWTQMIAACPAYYLIQKEAEIIREFSSIIGSFLPQGMTSVDLGPGESSAVLKKTIPFNRQLRNIHDFISVDINGVFARQGARLVGNVLSVPSSSMKGNFLAGGVALPTRNRTVATLFGGLLCNAPRGENIPGYVHLRDSFESLSHNFKAGDYLVITQDTNNDSESLIEAYSHPLMGKYILSVLHKIYRDLPTENFDPGLYEFAVKWDPQEDLLSLNARLKTSAHPHSFRIAGVPFTLTHSRLIPLVNSYKFSANKFVVAAEAAGFISRRTHQMQGNPIVIHVLEYRPKKPSRLL
jgi:uncharacterized SAM-dependent methyltransferase